MATTAVYTLLEMEDRSAPVTDNPDEGEFEIGGRTSWEFELALERIDAGVTLQVVVEASPTGDDDDWEEVHDFGAKSDADLSSSPLTKKDVSVSAFEKFLRARAKSLDGEATFEVTATSPFFDPADADDKDLLTKKLRDHSELARFIERAEADLLDEVIGRTRLGRLEADLVRPNVLDRIKRAIARHAEHLLQRELLAESTEASALVTLRQMGEYPDGIDNLLDPILDDQGLVVWKGR